MNFEKMNRHASVATAISIAAQSEPPSKDLEYWAGSAERAKERMRNYQELLERHKMAKCRECPQDCADCIYEED